ncbi:hypothetical protein N7468_007276 [Penicillium chermesinum]|uniref:Uncharacterized protein n=1 Tax=Penicillium chermesinum TaxID=63820 RepID=A0A9W9NTS8_9EURO|nr:uncharacterized protein N7468_007276 [Penicillium chermesinum]KAJ5226051.1 hypothetical protein N7468_007276 [Penicillium chermesinum]
MDLDLDPWERVGSRDPLGDGDTSFSEISPYWPPIFTESDNTDTLLVVILAQLNEKEKKYLGLYCQHFSGRKVLLWTPSKSILECLTVQGVHRDSQANVYGLARLAHTLGLRYDATGSSITGVDGRTFFMVVDEKAKVDGLRKAGDFYDREGNMREIPLLAVSVREGPPFAEQVARGDMEPAIPDPENDYFGSSSLSLEKGWGSIPGFEADPTRPTNKNRWGIRVAVSRHIFQSNGMGDLNFSDSEMQKTWDAPFSSLIERRGSEIDCFDNRLEHGGMILHNPDRGIFTVESPDLPTRWESLYAAIGILSQRLPAELVAEILKDVDKRPNRNFPRGIPVWLNRQTDKHTHILVMFEANDDEIRCIKDVLHHAICEFSETPGHTFELITWDQHRIRSRRDLFAFWEEYTHCDPDWRLGKPTLNLLLNSPKENDLHALQRYGVYGAEISYNPDQPFWHVLPPAEPDGIDYLACEGYQLRGELCDKISVYYVFRPTDSEYFEAPTEFKGLACYAPWRKERDGTLEDIWEIVLRIYMREDMGFHCSRFFCLDRQSLVDNTLLLVEPDFYLGGKAEKASSFDEAGPPKACYLLISHGDLAGLGQSTIAADCGISSRDLDFEQIRQKYVNRFQQRSGWALYF